MGIMDKISDKFSLATVHPEIEVLDKYIFHKVPFNLRVKLVAGNKKIKINQLEVDLIWEEVKMFDSLDVYSPEEKILQGRTESHNKHIIFKQKTWDPIKLAPNGSFSVDLIFNSEKAVRYRYTDKFYIRVYLDVPKAPEIRDRKDIEVLPHLDISAPMITMVEKMRFKRKQLHKMDIDKDHWNQWLLRPMEGTYSYLDEVLLTVDESEGRKMVVSLDIRMCEDLHSPEKGVTEIIRDSFIIGQDELISPDGKIYMDILSNSIFYILTEAEKKFYQTMLVNRGSGIGL